MTKPIIFNTEMVRAILDGRKTVTRRVIKPQPLGRIAYIMAGYKHGLWGYPGSDTYKYWGDEWKKPEGLSSEESNRHWAPPCHTDDILYVRETWGDYRECTEDGGGVYVLYRADYPDGAKQVTHPDGIVYELPKWHPSIHMPKGAARIFLRVTDVRVERLQDMKMSDIQAEGVVPVSVNGGQWQQWQMDYMKPVWDKTIKNRGCYGWDANPWVWVIEFERCDQPVLMNAT